MAVFKNLLNQKIGRLTVIAREQNILRKSGSVVVWRVRCDCGTEKTIEGSNLRAMIKGKYNVEPSCGCTWKEKLSKMRKTHGFSANGVVRPEYYVWSTMKARCGRESSGSFEHYGAKGICVCERWIDSFENFIADMGERPSAKHSIERKDPHGMYCPENCIWATIEEQSRNRTDSRKITFNGVTRNIVDWADEYGINRRTLYDRITAGWSIEDALSGGRHNEKPLTINGETKSITAWCKLHGISIQTFSYRIQKGWTVIDALTTPKHAKQRTADL